MTQIYNQQHAGRGTHALVIGVGHYPDAKPGRGARKDLRTVPDLPSAADSAKLMCDWLMKNRDELAAPLASLEVVIAEPPDQQDRYQWINAQNVEDANSINVNTAGTRWLKELTAKPGEIGFFYACGHGAGLSTQPVVFLSDLNANPVNPWAHHNIGMTASALRHLKGVEAAFFFSDTCREFIPSFQLGNSQDLSRFVPPPDPFEVGRDKVSLLCAASEAVLAYEGPVEGGTTKFGRFTQTLIKGLDGASARWRGNAWSVHPSGLFDDMKLLQRAYRPDWRAEPFEPSHPMTQNQVVPIVRPSKPRLPMLVLTDPEDAMDRFELGISPNDSGQKPWIDTRGEPARDAWLAHVPGGLFPLYAVAAAAPACHASIFVPNTPIFELRIPIP
jgi:hypothetical protein